MLRRPARAFLSAILRGRLTEIDDARLAEDALVVAPHPDDETLGCGGTILIKRALGARIGIVFLSDGAASHARFVSAEELARTREGEAREAARRLDVPAGDVHFLGHPDGRLEQARAPAVDELVALLDAYTPGQVFIPYRREMPSDHLAAHCIALEALHRRGRGIIVYEYPVWFWQHPPWAGWHYYAPQSRLRKLLRTIQNNYRLVHDFRHGVCVGQVLARKVKALEAHATQMSRPADNDQWPILADISDGDFLRSLLLEYELFFAYDWQPAQS